MPRSVADFASQIKPGSSGWRPANALNASRYAPLVIARSVPPERQAIQALVVQQVRARQPTVTIRWLYNRGPRVESIAAFITSIAD